MMAGAKMLVSVFIVSIYAVSEVSAYSCYNCDSNTSPASCSNTVVLPTAPTGDSCSCCRKSVSNSVTTRECVQSIETLVKCVPIPDTIYVCNTDRCNSAPEVTPTPKGVTLLATCGAALFAAFRQQMI